MTDIARDEPVANAFLASEPWNPSAFRMALAGTKFLGAFDKYLEDYGHRAVGESDVMSPRLADNPESILSIVRLHLISVSPSQQSILSRQGHARNGALAGVSIDGSSFFGVTEGFVVSSHCAKQIAIT
jgi:pyruvate,water dikinase